MYIYWPKVNLYQFVVGQQSVRRLFKLLANIFCKCFFKKWSPVAILDVQKSLCIAFLTISDQYHNFYFCDFILQNGCRWPFWMSENHFRSHFWPFQINTKLLFFFIFTKWPAGPILDVRNSLLIAFLAISDQYAALIFVFNFLCEFFTKWLPAAILDVRKSLSVAFLAISDKYATF